MTEEKMRAAITNILNHGQYPSSVRVARECGRNNTSLKGSECIMRRKLFQEFGIAMKRTSTYFGKDQ